MKNNIATRTGADRLRYTILFELTLLSLLVPIGAMVFEQQFADIGLLAVGLSLKAMIINLIYNWFFDQWDVRAGRIPSNRSLWGRILHAVGFEACLMITSLPIVIWWLGLTLVEALVTDLAVTSIVVIYTLVYGWIYDRLFPVLQPSVSIGISEI